MQNRLRTEEIGTLMPPVIVKPGKISQFTSLRNNMETRELDPKRVLPKGYTTMELGYGIFFRLITFTISFHATIISWLAETK